MNAAIDRRQRWHAPERSGPSFALSILAHLLLFASIAFVVRWKTEPAPAVSAELWGALPPIVAEPAPVEPPPPARPEPRPEPPPVKAEIVEKKAEPVRKPEPRKEEKRPEPKVDAKAEALKREAAERAEKAAQAKAAEQRRLAAVQRAQAAAGGAPAAAAGGEPGLARGYEAQVIGCIRPHIVYSVPEGLRPKQHVAEFEVQLLPTGEQLGAPRLVKASGLGAYDQAVERAIRRCDPFPRPREGAMPRTLRLTFDPVELR